MHRGAAIGALWRGVGVFFERCIEGQLSYVYIIAIFKAVSRNIIIFICW